MKKIYIEAGSFYGQRSGVGRFSLRISQALAEARPQDAINFFSFLRLGRKAVVDFDIPSNVRLRFIRWFPGRLFSLLMRHGISTPLEILGVFKADVVIFPNFISWSSLFKKRRVAVVHDLAFIKYPDFINPKNLKYLRKQLGKSIKRSSAIVAVSEFTKSDIINNYKISADKVFVVYNAVDHVRYNPSASGSVDDMRNALNIDGEYILFVGNIEPRKNITGMLEAYSQSFNEHRLQLVIAGAKGWNDADIHSKKDTLKDLPISFLDYVDEAHLPALYAGAKLFVYPSFYEGFGLPVLEAMACGCPVVCSNTSSLPEVAGQAATQVSPDDPTAISQAIIELANNEELRNQHIKMGLEQAQKFSWQSSAAELSNLIDSLSK